jgi:hypothetical protein
VSWGKRDLKELIVLESLEANILGRGAKMIIQIEATVIKPEGEKTITFKIAQPKGKDISLDFIWAVAKAHALQDCGILAHWRQLTQGREN